MCGVYERPVSNFFIPLHESASHIQTVSELLIDLSCVGSSLQGFLAAACLLLVWEFVDLL